MKALVKKIVRYKHADESLDAINQAHDVIHSKISGKLVGELIRIKEDRNNRFREQYPLFLLIGLIISLLLVTAAINWKTYDSEAVVDLGEVDADFEEIMEVPISNQPPPPPPKKVEVLNIQVVDDAELIEEVEINLDVEVTQDEVIENVVYDNLPIDEEMVEEQADEIFLIVEDNAGFPGGISEFYNYVASNIEYPSLARRLGVSGKVYVKFIVEKDGSITSVQAIKGIGAGCDEEAVRVIKNSPKWIPARQRGNKVRVWMIMPIHFTLRE